VIPTVRLSGGDGEIAMEDNIATGNFTGGLVTPDKDAVILVFPAAMPSAKPIADILATLVLELAQVTVEEISAVEPSE
jgi:hypothetical protein